MNPGCPSSDNPPFEEGPLSETRDEQRKLAKKPESRANELRPCYAVDIMPIHPTPPTQFRKIPAGARRTCYSVDVMQFQPPDSARYSPKIPPIPAPDTPLREKNIGRHLGTFGDIWGHMSPLNAKTREFRSQETKEPDGRHLNFANMRILGPTVAQTRVVL